MNAPTNPRPRPVLGKLRKVPELEIHQLVTVYTVSNPVIAEIIENALHNEGIRCFLEGENQAGEAGLTVMEIKVQVPIADADRARKFIQSHEHLAKG